MKCLVLLCLLARPALAADPPDWYAHIPAEQRAALLAMRHAGPPRALIGIGSVHAYRGPASATYAAPQSPASFDASALVHPPQYDLDYHSRQRAIERRILWVNRQPEVHKPLTVRRVARGEWHECEHF